MPQEWHFKDRSGKVQGPFKSEEMRAWYEAGYLHAELMICKGNPQRGNKFQRLGELYPNGVTAFMDDEPAAEVASGGQWYFVDKHGQVQGPFSDIHMRQWHMAGYFEGTLQVMNAASQNPQWHMLRNVFPNLADAFLVQQQHSQAPSQQPRGQQQPPRKNKGKKPKKTGRRGSSKKGRNNQAQQRGNNASRKPGIVAGPTDINKSRFDFPDWLPVPIPFKGVLKVYPSEKAGAKKRVDITDVHGKNVTGFR